MIILPEDKNIISLLPAEDAQMVLLALFSEPDDIPSMTPIASMAYTVIKSKSDRISRTQSANGKKGGRPKKPNVTQKTQPNPNETKKPSVTVSDTVTNPVATVINNINPAREAPEPAASEPAVDEYGIPEVPDDTAAVAEVVQAYADNIGVITPSVREYIDGWVDEAEPAMVVALIKSTAADARDKHHAKYIDGAMMSLHQRGITTLAAYKAHEAERKAAKRGREPPPEAPRKGPPGALFD